MNTNSTRSSSLKNLCVLFTFTMSLNAESRLCQKPIVDQSNKPPGFDLSGIGDGCTLSGTFAGVHYSLDSLSRTERKMAERFKDTFHNACVRHDKCLTEIGNAALHCHNEFHGNMRQSCDSAFKWYQFVDREMCRRTARGFYDGVLKFGTESAAKYFQIASLVAARQLRAQVEADQCGSSVAHSGLYSTAISTEIDYVFQSQIGRKPTIYEAFYIASDENIVRNKSAWLKSLSEYAYSLRNAPQPPSINLIRTDRDMGVTLEIQSNESNFKSVAMLNGAYLTGTEIQVARASEFNRSVKIQGFVKVLGSNGAKNMMLVDRSYTLRGYCSSRRGIACY